MNYIDPKSIINRTWWLLMVQGVLAALFGLAVLYDPGALFARIALVVAAFWMLGGLSDMFGGMFKYGADPDWWTGFVTGLLGVVCGGVLLAHAGAVVTSPPGIGGRNLAAPIMLGVGLGATLSGLINVAAAVRLRARIDAESAIVLWGVIQLMVGAWFASAPVFAELLTLIAIVATISIIAGMSLSVFGFRMKWIKGDGGGGGPVSTGSRRRTG
jgi:uncharacterized membrane protein HdeD (DUF308 family)